MMTTMSLRVLLATSAALAVAACGGKSAAPMPVTTLGPTASPTLQASLATIEGQLASCSIPGGAIAVVQHGKLTEAAGFGVKDAEGDGVRPATLFQTASLSKVVVGAAMLGLAEQGKVRLDQPVTDLVALSLAPGFDPHAITVADLLTHTSGLPDFDTGTASCSVGPGAIGQWFADQSPTPLWSAPGAVWDFSQRGYAAAGWIVETASAQPFEAAVASRVFAPAGMTSATYEPAVVLASGDYALGHLIDPSSGAALVVSPGTIDCAASRPGDGVFASVLDYAHLAETLLAGGGAMLTPASTTALETGQVVDDVYPGETYGYGLYQHEGYKGLNLRRVSGNLHGYDAALVLVPEQDFAVVLFYDGYNPSCSIMDTAESVTSNYLGLDGVRGPGWQTPSSAWAPFVGTYVDPYVLGTITVALDEGNLTATTETYGTVVLTNVSATAFRGDFGGRGETVTFDPGPSGAGSFFVTRLGVGQRR